MRELDRCDFCAERADGVYEVLPPQVDATERRLVLCADCRDTLAGVVDPLLDALDGRAAAAETDTADDRSVTFDAAESGADDDATTSDDAATDASDGDADGGTESTSDDAGAAANDGDENADAGSASVGDDANDAGAAKSSAGGRSGARPEGYRRVVRLLRNRPEAMTRTDLAELASGAYDIDADAVEDVVDAALENGHLEETPEGLRAT